MLFEWQWSRVGSMTTHPRTGSAYVLLVILDPLTHRLLLVRRSGDTGVYWSVPKAAMSPGMTCRRAAARFLRRRLGLPAVRIAPVIGRMFAIDDAVKTGYAVLVLPAAGRWHRRPGQMLGADARWWSVSDLRPVETRVQPAGLLDLVDGYWEGWLPDGEVSLV
jgi:ADP-ribose pyrophosphatase YjhB (NUDIX family)